MVASSFPLDTSSTSTTTSPKSCSEAGGESETHARCTAVAVAALARTFPDATVGAEVSFDVSATATSPDLRRADALVEFDEENLYFGHGLGIEVQHRHHSKDVPGTTHDYLRAGFSVAWLTPRDFEDDRLAYAVVEEAFQAVDGEAYSVREYEPWEFETRVEAGLAWELPTTSCWLQDVLGFEDHKWERIPGYAHPGGYDYEFCPGCASRRRYDSTLTRFVYDSTGVLAPTVDVEILRDAVKPHPDQAGNWGEPTTFEEWVADQRLSGPALVEDAIASRVDVAPCRGPHRIHEWNRVEVLKRNYRDEIGVSLWGCRHCPVHLVTNFIDNAEIVPHVLLGDEPKPNWGLTGLRSDPRFCLDWTHPEESSDNICSGCGLYYTE